jgi:hypothetical protein
MRERRFLRVRDRESGLIFVFKMDEDAPDMLHIYARHLTTPEEAIDTFFVGKTIWNAERRRFEASTETHNLFWFWLEQDSVVMVVSCFRR